MTTFLKIFLLFIIYSFIGYITEVIVCTIDSKKLVNRGFLFGPYCPIYGIGGLLISWCLIRYKSDPIVVFVFGVIITSVVEYYTSYILEKIFHNKWWDYSDRIDNINGRICLGNAVCFGILACAVVYFINPLTFNFLELFNKTWTLIIGLIVLIIFIVDLVWSIDIAYNLRNRLIVAEELKASKLKMIPSIIEEKFKNQIKKIKKPNSRLLKAFPDLFNSIHKELDVIRNIILKNTRKK